MSRCQMICSISHFTNIFSLYNSLFKKHPQEKRQHIRFPLLVSLKTGVLLLYCFSQNRSKHLNPGVRRNKQYIHAILSRGVEGRTSGESFTYLNKDLVSKYDVPLSYLPQSSISFSLERLPALLSQQCCLASSAHVLAILWSEEALKKNPSLLPYLGLWPLPPFAHFLQLDIHMSRIALHSLAGFCLIPPL